MQALYLGLGALGISTLVALLLAQWTLRPVHVLQSGFARLGRGEFDVKLDLPPGDEFSELGASFNKLSAELSTVRTQIATGQAAPLESVVDRLQDAVAMVNPEGASCSRTPRFARRCPAPLPGRRWRRGPRASATGRSSIAR